MKPVLVDTDILSLFLRGNTRVKAHFADYVQEYDQLNLSIITYYEIVSGLKHRDAQKQLNVFLALSQRNNVLALTEGSVSASADQYARLRKAGQSIDDIDLLIAGIALVNNLTVATHNRDHFKRIEGLEIIDWSD